MIEFIEKCRKINNFIENSLTIFKNFLSYVKYKNDWFSFPYTKLVDHDFDDLSAYLSVQIKKDFTVDKEYSRVIRTKKYGDWKNWFTDKDIARLEPLFTKILGSVYPNLDWTIDQKQEINPNHGSAYIRSLVQSRRKQFGLPPLSEEK